MEDIQKKAEEIKKQIDEAGFKIVVTPYLVTNTLRINLLESFHRAGIVYEVAFVKGEEKGNINETPQNNDKGKKK